jgi:REP element-mobilizing transposase RayT
VNLTAKSFKEGSNEEKDKGTVPLSYLASCDIMGIEVIKDMPRCKREKSKSGIYHIMVRGINRQEIFHDDEDRQRYLSILQKANDSSQCEIYGYCLMNNHVHLLLREGKDDISQIMKRIGVSYVYWYNDKYERSGHLFQDRYRSEKVEDDDYFLGVLRYIHQNPWRAGIARQIADYEWSSYRLYVGQQGKGFVNTEFALAMLHTQRDEATKRYIQFMNEENHIRYLAETAKKKWSDNEIREELKLLIAGRPVSDLTVMSKQQRDEVLRNLKSAGNSVRQIARITALGRNIVANA